MKKHSDPPTNKTSQDDEEEGFFMFADGDEPQDDAKRGLARDEPDAAQGETGGFR